jgi:pilus assembly protein Flp/PilA
MDRALAALGRQWRRWRSRPKAGVTALEYGLIASLVAVAIVGSVSLLGTSLSSTFNKVSTTL